jgi:hypothetical protein
MVECLCGFDQTAGNLRALPRRLDTTLGSITGINALTIGVERSVFVQQVARISTVAFDDICICRAVSKSVYGVSWRTHIYNHCAAIRWVRRTKE